VRIVKGRENKRYVMESMCRNCKPHLNYLDQKINKHIHLS